MGQFLSDGSPCKVFLFKFSFTFVALLLLLDLGALLLPLLLPPVAEPVLLGHPHRRLQLGVRLQEPRAAPVVRDARWQG